MSGIFNTAIFNDAIFNTASGPALAPITVVEEQASNWQANYWKHKTKKQRELEIREERIRLGILPPELARQAKKAIAQALQASVEATAGSPDPGRNVLAAMEAREKYDDAYRKVYKDAYVGQIIEFWKRDIKREQHRRTLVTLLLH